MSGHSRWHNIRVKKMAGDARKGKVYTRHAKLIEIAVQRGGDPAVNAALRAAIESAKAENVPNANIERAVKKGTGELKGEQMAEIVYAAYAPGGAACLIECLTDNRNRTIANVKAIINKNGGTFAESGSVLWMFQRRGVVVARLPGEALAKSGSSLLITGLPEEVELKLIDQGAEEIEVTGDVISVTTSIGGWAKVRDFLKGQGWTIESAGLKYEPTQKQAITDVAAAQKLMQFVSALEEDDDVSEVHTNADIAEDVASTLG